MANYPQFQKFSLMLDSSTQSHIQAHICHDGNLFKYSAAVCSRCPKRNSASFFITEDDFIKMKMLFDIVLKKGNTQSSEYRLGNYIYYDGYIERIASINNGLLNVLGKGDKMVFPHELLPITVTEDLLLNLGFIKVCEVGVFEIRTKYKVISIDIKTNQPETLIGLVSITTITDDNNPNEDMWQELNVCKYLHQLQNIYFALTGEELVLKSGQGKFNN